MSNEQEDYLIGLDAKLCKDYFYHMVRQAWLPCFGEPLIDGWHIAAMCYHLQALVENKLHTADGRVADTLVINLPSGCTKSSVVSVLFPAWLWGKMPHYKMWYESFEPNLAVRDASATRDIVKGDWFNERFWRKEVSISADQDQKTIYRNTVGGWRMSYGIGMKAGFGWHPNLLCVDDPHSPAQALDPNQCGKASDKWRKVFASRGMTKDVKRVLAAQRLGELDLSQFVLENEPRVVHLRLPMWYEKDDPCKTNLEYCDIDDIDDAGDPRLKTSWEDPRTEERQLMWPELMNEERVERLKMGLRNAHMISAQMQQKPTAPSGDFFQSEWFNYVDTYPKTGMSFIRSWDKAASTGTKADYTAGALVGFDGEFFYVVHVMRGKWERKERDAIILKTCLEDAAKYGTYTVLFEQEPGSGGKESAQISASQIRDSGIRVRIERPTSKKVVMWDTLQGEMAKGRVRVVKGPWNDMWSSEMLSAGPDGVYGTNDDMIDATASGVRKAAKASGVGKIKRPLLLVTEEEQEGIDSKKPKVSEIDEYLNLIDSNEHDTLGIKW